MPTSNTNCCVVGCSSTYQNSPGIKLYSFPNKPYEAERRQRWIALVRRQNKDGTNWVPARHSRICSQHFVGNAKSNEEGHPAYHPSIFPTQYKAAAGPLSGDRYVRKKRRGHLRAQQSKHASSDDERMTRQSSPDEQAGESQYDSDDAGCNHGVQNINEGTHQSVDASTMTEDGDQFFSADFTFMSELCDGNASSYIRHKEVRTTDLGSSSAPDLSDKTTGPVCKQPFFGGYASLRDDEDQFHDLTAVTFPIFALLLSLLAPTLRKVNELSIENKLLLFLIKLKHGLPFSALGVLFRVHRKTAARIFKGLLVNIHAATKDWLYRPSRKAIRATLPPSFKKDYPNCRAIIDCTEIETEVPSGVERQNLWFSHYKGRHTVKYLIAIAPNGLVTFLSNGFGGRTTDATLTIESGFLSLLEPGDAVLADKGFPGIKTGFGSQNATLVTPPFATRPQFTESEVNATYESASVRIHVERVIQRLKIFNIITHRMPYELTPYADKILHVLAVVTNLKSPIFAKESRVKQ